MTREAPSYREPLQPDYAKPAYRRARRLGLPRALGALRGRDHIQADNGWIYCNMRRPGGPRENPYWQPKLYLCVRAKNYWPCIARLAPALADAGVPWKFHTGKSHADRPDKIVLYPDPAKLSSVVSLMRRLAAGSSFHEMTHAAPVAAYGLERAGEKGLYVGADPQFLRQASWRIYHCFLGAWAELNRDEIESLPGGRARWMRRMNLSLDHEGPRSLRPPRGDMKYVARYWKLAFPKGWNVRD